MSSITLGPDDLARVIQDFLGARVRGVSCSIEQSLEVLLVGFDPELSVMGVRLPRIDVTIAATARLLESNTIEVSYEVRTSRLVVALGLHHRLIHTLQTSFCRIEQPDSHHLLLRLDGYRFSEFRLPARPFAVEAMFSTKAV